MTRPMMGPLCGRCNHIRKDYTCAAFPDGIPAVIAIDGFDHTTSIDGDHGIRFEQRQAGSSEPVFDDLDPEKIGIP